MNDDVMTYEIFSSMPLMVMSMIMATLTITTLPSVVQTVKAQQYQGKTIHKVLNADNELRWLDILHDEYPYIPWICAYIINSGPGTVEVAINYPGERFIMNKNETVTITRSGANERIAIIFYKCIDDGSVSTIRVMGEY